MTDEPLTEVPLPAPADDEAPRKSLTIGAVCKALSQEFPDISISKIRYLEDQKLLTPRRTPGGYRLYAQSDVSRLRTILRLQRDEFLPLRVIRQELAAGRTETDTPGPAGVATTTAAPAAEPVRPGAALRRLTFSIQDRGALYSLDDVIEETGAEPRLVKEPRGLRDRPRASSAAAPRTTTRPSERSSARSPSSPATGVAGRNLRVFKSSSERESALLQQILAPSLRSRNPERRKEAIEALENLAAVASHLKHLLLVRDLRRIAK